MADRTSTLTAEINAKDNTRGGIDSASAGFDKLKGAALKLGAVIAGAFAIDKIKDFGVASFNAFADAEASGAKVNAILATMGKQGEAAKGAIEKVSQAALKLAFDDEDAAESMAKLFQVTKDTTKAQELQAVAMDLARGKGIELSDATRIVTLMLAGNTKELKALGVAVSDTATPLENLAIVQKQYAGQAEAYANTTKGALDKLSNAYENLQESVGSLLAEAFTPLISKMADFLSTLPPVDVMLNNLKSSVMSLASELDMQTGIVTFLNDAWMQIWGSISTNLIPAFEQLFVVLEPYMPWIKSFAGYLGSYFGVILLGIVQTLGFMITTLVNLLAAGINLSSFLIKTLGPAFSFISDSIATVVGWVNQLIAALTTVASKIGSALSGIGGLGGIAGKRADGGPVSGGSTYLVGERGPELFTPSGSGTIIANGAGIGGATIAININGGIFLDEYGADLIGTQMVERLRTMFRF